MSSLRNKIWSLQPQPVTKCNLLNTTCWTVVIALLVLVVYQTAWHTPTPQIQPVASVLTTTMTKATLPPDFDPVGPTVRARITQYGWTGNRTASGKWPAHGMVAVSDRSIPFGTEIWIGWEKYIVEDYTALWVHKKHGFTVDIYSPDPHGLEYKDVQIIK